MTLRLYYDLMSQPSRALVMFLQAAKVPFEHRPIRIGARQHLTDEFKEISRFQKLPVIDDRGFKLTESVAIFRYLAREKLVPDHWYPRDSKRQAQVDEYLEWQHNNTRSHCAMYFMVKWLQPLMTGTPASPEKIEAYEKRLNKCMDQIETLWLHKTPYLCGERITVADLLGTCEIEQPRIAGYDARIGRPRIAAWMDRVRADMNPYYDEAHSVIYKLAEQFKEDSGNVKKAKM